MRRRNFLQVLAAAAAGVFATRPAVEAKEPKPVKPNLSHSHDPASVHSHSPGVGGHTHALIEPNRHSGDHTHTIDEPAGTVRIWLSGDVPSGWAFMDGRANNRERAGSGIDMRGRWPGQIGELVEKLG